MKELIDIPQMWDRFINFGKENILWLILMVFVSGFIFGVVYEAKTITDDCKFMGIFRDGPVVYECRIRVRG